MPVYTNARRPLTEGGVLLGSGSSPVRALDVLANGEMIVGDGTTDPVAESGSTLRTSIGVAIGTDVQAWDTQLDDIAALAVTDGNIIVGDGTNWVAESGSTALTSLGAQATNSQLDNLVGLDVTDGNFIVGDGSNLVTESGSTARTSLGVGTSDSPTFAGLTLTTTTDALTLPRLTTIERDALTAVDGMILFNTTVRSVQRYKSVWRDIDTDTNLAVLG